MFHTLLTGSAKADSSEELSAYDILVAMYRTSLVSLCPNAKGFSSSPERDKTNTDGIPRGRDRSAGMSLNVEDASGIPSLDGLAIAIGFHLQGHRTKSLGIASVTVYLVAIQNPSCKQSRSIAGNVASQCRYS